MNSTALGIDIGGTNTKLSLVSPEGSIIARSAFPTQQANTQDEYGALLVDAARRLLRKSAAPLAGVGIGAPGCDPALGVINYAANLPFIAAFPIRDFLAETLCAHTVLVKDSTAAALGEKMWGGAQNMDNFILLTLGTGLGSAFYFNGKVVEGAHGLASELGHITIPGNSRQCACGRKGCLETLVSASGLRRTCQLLMAQELTPSALRALPEDKLTAKSIALIALEGDPLAQMAIDHMCNALGSALAPLVLQMDPEGIFLSGGMLNAGALLTDTIAHHMNKALLENFRGQARVAISSLGPDEAGMLGAAAQVYRTAEQPAAERAKIKKV